MKIISGPSSQTLASRVAFSMNLLPHLVEYSQFPDKELYLRVKDGIDDEEVVIIQSTTTDTDFMSLLLLIDACSNAKKISVVIPYMGYSRQDKCFQPGEPISARVIAKSINCDQIYTINIHENSIFKHFDCNYKNIDASSLLSEYIKSTSLEEPFLIAPDKGASDLIEHIANNLNCEYEIFEKIRLNGDVVNIKEKKLNISNKQVFIIDDMISTGGTIVSVMNILLKNNVRNVFSMCVHPVFSKNAVLKIYNSGIKDIISTDTLEKIQSKISVSSLISNEINK